MDPQAIFLERRLAVLPGFSPDCILTITTLYDINGEMTEDPENTTAFICQNSAGQAFAAGVVSFTKETVH
jgi:hypothetical protein